MCSSSNAASVASPATIASWLRPKVVECFIAFSSELNTDVKTRSVVSIAPTGTYPPDSALDTVMMSGRRSQCSWQKNFPVRPSPVCTSSSTSSVLYLRHSACASCQYSGGAS